MIEEQPPGNNREGLTGPEWILLIVLAAMQFTHMVDLIIVQPLGPQFSQVLKITPQAFGFLVAAYGFSAGVTGLLSALLLQRFDRKRTLLLMYAGFTASTLLCALAPNYWVLFLARALAGGFGGVVGATVLAIVGDVIPYSRRGRAMGIIMLAFSAAMIVGVPAGLALAGLLGWWAPFAVLGGLSAVMWVVGALVLPPVRGHVGDGARTPGSLRHAVGELGQVIGEPNHLRAYALMFSLVLGVAMLFPYVSMFLVGNVGVAVDDLKFIFLVGGLATLVTVPMFGWMADRFGKLPVFRVMATFTAIPILLLTNLPPVPLALAIAASTLLMVTTSARMVPAQALITACAEPRRRGGFLSVVASVQQIAGGLASVIGGLIIGKSAVGEGLEVTTDPVMEPISNYPWVGVVSVAFTLLSVYLAGRLRQAAAPPVVVAPPQPDEVEVGDGLPVAT